MEEKIKQNIREYENKLKRKQRKIEPLLKIKNTMDGFGSDIKSEIEYNILDAEINVLKTILDDFKYLLE